MFVRWFVIISSVYPPQISYLEGAVVSKPPDAGCYRDGRHEEERHEDEKPEVVSPRHTVAHQHLEHQQQDVQPHCDQHGLELHTRLPFSPNGGYTDIKTSESSSTLTLIITTIQFLVAHFHDLGG